MVKSSRVSLYGIIPLFRVVKSLPIISVSLPIRSVRTGKDTGYKGKRGVFLSDLFIGSGLLPCPFGERLFGVRGKGTKYGVYLSVVF